MNEDSINLLKECNSGCKMAIESMERVEKNLADNEMKSIIDEYKDKHVSFVKKGWGRWKRP